MKIKTQRHLRILRHTTKDPKTFLKQSLLVKWVLFIIILASIYWLLTGPYFRIKQVICRNQDGEDCDQVVVAELNNHQYKSIFTTNTKQIQSKLEKANPSYQNVRVITKLPNTLEVSMTDKAEYANIKIASDSASLIIDQNMLVVDKQPKPSPNLFTIIAPSASKYSIGDQINDEALLKTFEIAKNLHDRYLVFDYLKFESPTMITAVFPDGKKAIFTITQDISRQVTSLQLILSKATITPEPREFDMRFDKPVLK